jgi:hypothetical protein
MPNLSNPLRQPAASRIRKRTPRYSLGRVTGNSLRFGALSELRVDPAW